MGWSICTNWKQDQQALVNVMQPGCMFSLVCSRHGLDVKAWAAVDLHSCWCQLERLYTRDSQSKFLEACMNAGAFGKTSVWDELEVL